MRSRFYAFRYSSEGYEVGASQFPVILIRRNRHKTFYLDIREFGCLANQLVNVFYVNSALVLFLRDIHLYENINFFGSFGEFFREVQESIVSIMSKSSTANLALFFSEDAPKSAIEPAFY